MELKFKKIGIFAKPSVPNISDTVVELITYLQSLKATIGIEDEASQQLNLTDLPSYPAEQLVKKHDLLIVVGGDGSLLSVARWAVESDKPVLGINRGRLGFLTDINPQLLSTQLSHVLSGEFQTEKRFLLEANLIRQGELIPGGKALNDVVLYSGKIARMIEFEVWIDGEFVYKQRSDGLIASTPTGSTAYSLSGGGPIIYPTLDALLLVPMHPHTLSNRPIVINGSSHVELRISPSTDHLPHVSCDGQLSLATAIGDYVSIKRYEKALTLIHPKDHSFYKVLRNKLGWGLER
ncbi:MAG: NAD(+) kinase [Legionellales bacterium]|nr:NAD(+) kinase [Legionellales bacterium]|tara:strand:- start:262 stop:1140 length:879 start_codon:yes stop_codon:yes gene_type:complete